jgi:hypothetical protein
MTALGEEHKKRLMDTGGNPNAFISIPMPTKAMWDTMQGMHRLTLSGCLLLEHSVHNGNFVYRNMLENIMECGTSATLCISRSRHGMPRTSGTVLITLFLLNISSPSSCRRRLCSGLSIRMET